MHYAGIRHYCGNFMSIPCQSLSHQCLLDSHAACAGQPQALPGVQQQGSPAQQQQQGLQQQQQQQQQQAQLQPQSKGRAQQPPSPASKGGLA